MNRTVERAQAIAEPLKGKWGSLDQLSLFVREGYHCLVQATSVGMAPAVEETPVSAECLGSLMCVLDVIANPVETRLLREAKQRGSVVISGRELFVFQAVKQFVCWFGEGIDQKKVERLIRERLPAPPRQSGVRVSSSVLKGSVTLPPSKSHTNRAILLAAMAHGTSTIHGLLDSPDTACALQAAEQLGALLSDIPFGKMITGVAGHPRVPSQVIDAGNSGQVLRFVAALTALSKGYTVITGDHSVRSSRLIQPLIDGLQGLNGLAVSTRQNGHAPLIVKGPLQAGRTVLNGRDSQPVSALLMAASFIEGETVIEVEEAGEKPWVALTLSWLDRLGVSYTHHQFERFTIRGQRLRPSFTFTIPGDLSSLSFPLVAALVTHSELTIHGVDRGDCQGDQAIIDLLQRMGADIIVDPSQKTLTVRPSTKLRGQIINVNDFIDAVPILSVLGCYAEGETILTHASVARHKECNRLACLTSELRKMGAAIEETEDGLHIWHSSLKGAEVSSHTDHRLAMALLVAGLGAKGETFVQGTECIAKSYPTFIQDLSRVGAHFHEVK